MSATETSFYVTGGTLRHDAPSYVERQADCDVSEGLLAGEFCYVLTPRQMGKSSLMVRTASKLRERGVNVIALDLTAIGQNLTAEQWYDGLIARMGRQLRLDEELDQFWSEQERLGPCQRLFAAIRDVVLRHRRGPLAIFVDEIDTVRSLPFSTDEFFAAIRECYNRRAEDPELNRLTFCLLGVATPFDLIRDTRTTPFNIGRRIELHDFAEAEAAPLAKGLTRWRNGTDGNQTPQTVAEAEAAARDAERLLKRILFWTGGHPYLTQRFCQAVAGIQSAANPADVDGICEALFLSSRAQERDDNLLFVRERLLRSETDLTSLLELYRKVRGGRTVPDDQTSQLISVLRLSGIVKAEGGYLRQRNRIYTAVFDNAWIQAHLPDVDVRRQRAAFWRGVVRTTGISAVVVAALAVTVVQAVSNYRKARESLAQAYFSQAKARRVSGLAGQRLESLSALGNARRSYTNEAALRDEAIACLALVDLGETTNSGYPLRHTNVVELSPDLQVSAVAAEDGVITLRRLPGGQLLRTLSGFDSPAKRLRFSQNGALLIAEYCGRSQHQIVVWDWPAGKKLFAAGHGVSGNAIDFSADGEMLAVGRPDGKVVVYSLPHGDVLCELEQRLDIGYPRKPQVVRFSPSGNLLAACSLYDHYVEIWNLGTTQRMARPYHAGVVHDISWHPRGELLAAACRDSRIYLWRTNDLENPKKLSGHEGPVTAVTFNHSGTLLASLGSDETVRLWIPGTERQMALAVSGEHFDRLQFSIDDRRLIATDKGQTNSRVWEALGSELTVLHAQRRRGDDWRTIDFSPNSRWLLAARGRQVTIWDADSGRELGAFPLANAWAAWFSADGQHLITSSDAGLLELPLRFHDSREQPRLETGIVQPLYAKLDDLGMMVLSMNRSQAAVVHMDEVLLVSLAPDAAAGVRTIPLNTNYHQLALHPEVTWLAARTGGSSALHLWNLSKAAGHSDPSIIPGSDHFAFSPNGKWLVTCWQGEFQFYRVGAWEQPAFRIPRKPASEQHAPVAFSSDSRTVALASSRYAIQLFKLPESEDGQAKLIATLEGPDHLPLAMLAFSPDGHRLAAASGLEVIQLWNIELLRKGLAQLQIPNDLPCIPPDSQ